MTGDEFIRKQKERLQKAQEKAFKIAVFDSHRLMGNRIFVNGEAADDRKIGSYNSTNPIYVNPKNSPRKFTPEGKPKETGKKGARSKTRIIETDSGTERLKFKHTTRYFESYKAFRGYIGRKTDVVNLNLFGILQNDFITGLRKVDNSTYEAVLKQGINVKKAQGQEKHFGKKIFSLSKHEREQLYETVRRETILIMQGNA